MSSSAAAVKPPIQLFGLEGRYATALYTGATKLKQLESVEKDVVEIQNVLKQNPKLREILVSPIINRKVLEQTLKDFSGAVKLAPATGNLLVLLAENGRLKKIEGIINAFKQLMSAHRGEIICEIKTARALDASQRKNLQAALAVSHQYTYVYHIFKELIKFLFLFAFSEIRQIERINSIERSRRSLNYWRFDCINRG